MATRITLKGTKVLEAALKKAAKDAPRLMAFALDAEGADILAESKDRVPIDTGVLKNSGFQSNPQIRSGKVTVELGYGGAAARYATAVHEHPSRHSPRSWANGVNWSRPGTGPKFLERPMLEAAAGMGGRLAAKIRGRLGRR